LLYCQEATTLSLKKQPDDSHFEILGITRFSTREEIKKAYRNQIKKWHPDKFHNSPEKIQYALEVTKQINEAFELLENYEPLKTQHSDNTSKSYKKRQTTSAFNYRSSPPKATRLNILRASVKSPNIISVGYDKLLKVLQVEFLNGSIYQYYEVPEQIFTDLLKAGSKGKFFNSKISLHFRHENV
jgi:KTSC domain/DnaJ domain